MSLTGLVLGAMALLAGCSAASEEAGDTATGAGNADATEFALKTVDGALGDMILGDPNAPVTLVEYASFTCGHCANFHINVLPDVKEKFINTGKVRMVFREMPTAPQELSYIGSLLARCAADTAGDEAYFAIADSLFRGQTNWAFGNDPKLELLKIANQAGMDEAALNSCLRRQELVDLINDNVLVATQDYKITGTPGFILQNEKLKLQTFSELDEALANAYAKATGTPLETDEKPQTQAPALESAPAEHTEKETSGSE